MSVLLSQRAVRCSQPHQRKERSYVSTHARRRSVHAIQRYCSPPFYQRGLMVQGTLLHVCRRGKFTAEIYSVCFSLGAIVGGRREQSGKLLCAASSTGTIHVWRLEAPLRAGAAVPLLSGDRSFAQIRLKRPAGTRYVATLRDTMNQAEVRARAHTQHAFSAHVPKCSASLLSLAGTGACIVCAQRVG